MTRHALFIHDNRSLGGVGQVSRQIAEGLAQRGWSVDHLELATPASAWAHLRQVERLRGVIVATQNFSTAYVACALAAIGRRPWVMCVHGPVARVLEAARPGAAKRALMRFTYRRAPFIVCSSQSSCESLAAFAPPDALRQDVRVIRNTAAPGFFLAGSRMPGSSGHRIGFVGRLSAEKRPALLVDTLRLLPAHYRMQVVGTGPLAQELAAKAGGEIASGRLAFAGQQTITADTYRQWDATLLCSSYEGYPLVLLESLASGVPVVSTPLPPVTEMLGRHAPYMIAADSTPAALARAVQDVMAKDPAQIARDIAGINAAHDPVAFVAAWDELLSEAVGS